MQVTHPRGEKDVADSGAQPVSAESPAGDVDNYKQVAFFKSKSKTLQTRSIARRSHHSHKLYGNEA